VFIWQSPGYAGQRSRRSRKESASIKEGSTCLFQNEIDKRAGIKILTRWFKVAARNSIKWSSITTEWKNASAD